MMVYPVLVVSQLILVVVLQATLLQRVCQMELVAVSEVPGQVGIYQLVELPVDPDGQ